MNVNFVLLLIQAPANKGTTVSFPIIPSVIGQMRVRVTARTSGAADAVQRNLLVEVSVYIHTWISSPKLCKVCSSAQYISKSTIYVYSHLILFSPSHCPFILLFVL